MKLTEQEAINILNGIEEVRGNLPEDGNEVEVDLMMAREALEEVRRYRALGTAEELLNSVKEEDILKFYYCESEDDYYIGKRIDTLYYAKYGKTGFTWFMSRYLPWGKHVVGSNTLWKEHTYPSEPKEIPFFEWVQGFLKKYCGGTVEEMQKAMEKQKANEPYIWGDGCSDGYPVYDMYDCPGCGKSYEIDGEKYDYCPNCGQAIDWSEEIEQ